MKSKSRENAFGYAKKVQLIAKKVGFDWRDKKGVFDKVLEEIKELKKAIRRKEGKEVEEELGDLFFSLVNLARHLQIDPEKALRKASKKFAKRFWAMRKKGKKRKTLREMDKIWEEIKGVTL